MNGSQRLAIVGASYGAVSMAEAARRGGWAGPITIVSSESYAPYERPALSKSFLETGAEPSGIALKGEAFYTRNGIELMTGTIVTDIDLGSRMLTMDGSSRLDFKALALATGSRPRALPVPGAELDGVLSVSTIEDAFALRERLDSAESVVIVGAGFIGLEIGATLRTLGKSVDVLEAAPRIMGRALSPSAAAFLADMHATHGVRIHTGAACAAFEGANGSVKAVRLGSGALLPADLVIVGVGAVARTELAQQTGLQIVSGGINVDSSMRTNAPDVYAMGDCASFKTRFAQGSAPLRLESVQNATDQGRTAGAVVAGASAEYDSVPWFWTEQYSFKMQMAGLLREGTRELQRGEPGSGVFSLLHVDAEHRLVAAESVGSPADHVAARAMIGATIDVEAATDTCIPLKQAIPAMSV
ncbi:FAD-dependent oxidoreductase [Arthrobacter sp. NPDC080031]|uniref:NAD(P)/FAD-dependent oxidoreductase n=1 Tax=Arthrobacter sp. NPDC080031 TaxID=3155918 RepID=UPI00344D4CEE